MTVLDAMMLWITALSSMPCRTARATYSGKRAAESLVPKNLAIVSLLGPLTLMSNRLSWR